MGPLRRRIEKLEASISTEPSMLDTLYNALQLTHSPEFRTALLEMFAQVGREPSQVSRRRLDGDADAGMASMLFTALDRDVFALERFRELVPDRVLAAVYNEHRNYAYPPYIADRVRRLAGVIDEDGSILPGFVMRENGCINDVEYVEH